MYSTITIDIFKGLKIILILGNSKSRGVDFRIRISQRFRRQNRNGSKCSVRDLCQTDLYKNIGKNGSLPCPFKEENRQFFGRSQLSRVVDSSVELNRRKIKLIESNAKCGYLKTCNGTLRQGFYLSDAPSPSMTPYSQSYTVYLCVHYYTFSHRGGGGLTIKTVRRSIDHKVGRKYQHVSSVHKLHGIKHQ